MTRRPRARPTRAARRPRPARRPRLIPLALAGVALLVIAVAAAAFLLPGPPARRGSATRLAFDQGTHLPAIAAGLQSGGVIYSSLAFIVAAKLTGAARSLKAGEYDFPSRASLAQVLLELRSGRVVRHFITIPEGFSSSQAAQVLRAAPELTGALVTPPEGSILPETYQVTPGETRAHVVARMSAARDVLLRRLWATRRPGLPYRTPEEAVVLASIVEKETALPSERAHIAAIFLNRLAKGMRLESDPTVVYGLTGGQPLGHGLRVSELQRPTPFNTYLFAGLPPTAIANPGRAALAAAMAPADTSDLYFVADGSGGHVFSATLAQHLANVARWRGIEQARAARPSAAVTP